MTSWTRLHCSLDPSRAPYWFSCRLASWHCTESLHTRFSLVISPSVDQYDLCTLVSHHKIQMHIVTMILASTACTTLNKNNKLLITIYLLSSSKLSFSLSFWLTSSSVPEPICILTLSLDINFCISDPQVVFQQNTSCILIYLDYDKQNKTCISDLLRHQEYNLYFLSSSFVFGSKNNKSINLFTCFQVCFNHNRNIPWLVELYINWYIFSQLNSKHSMTRWILHKLVYTFETELKFDFKIECTISLVSKNQR